VDFIANIDAFPKPDDKIRTTSLSVMGGGNAGNTISEPAFLRGDIPKKLLNRGCRERIVREGCAP